MVRGVGLFFPLLLFAGAAFADPVVDQSYLPGAFDSTAQIGQQFGDVDWAQTFTVGVTGTLTSVDVQIAKGSTTGSDLVVDVRTTTGGVPSSDAGILATMSVPASAVSTSPTFSLFSVDFTAFNLGVNTGDVLAVVLSSAATDNYLWRATSANGYSGGGAFNFSLGSWNTSSSFGDLMFQTWVEPTPTDDQGGGDGDGQMPEPSLLALAAAGLALARLRRRR
jgi:hypothetical protein